MKFIFTSPVTFERWSYRNPLEIGIGGSETVHVEMAERLAKRGHKVISYTPKPDTKEEAFKGVTWRDRSKIDFEEEGIWVISREPKLIDNLNMKNKKAWLVMQDIAYEKATKKQVMKFDKIFPLCKDHYDFTVKMWPYAKSKIVQSSNGIRTDYIEKVEKQNIERNPYRLMFASSPDRGLYPLLQIFKIAKLRIPQLELHVFYGFNNIDKICDEDTPLGMEKVTKRQILNAIKQPGVFDHGRIGQGDLYKEWFKSGIWCHPSGVFPETSPVHGDTLIDTLKGRIPIKDLVGKPSFYVYSCNSLGELNVSLARNVKCTRKEVRVIKITFSHGRGGHGKTEELTLTPDHEVMLSDGSYLSAGKLRLGDSVKAFYRQQNGWGDGYDMIGVTSKYLQPEHRFVAEWKLGRELKIGEIVDHVDGNKANNDPSNLEVKSQAQHAKDHYERSSDEYKEKRRQQFIEYLNSLSPEETSKLRREAVLIRFGKLKNHKVSKIEEVGAADVYCMEVEKDHNFVANNIFVHNCITSMDAQACGAIPITANFWGLKENVKFGYLLDNYPLTDPIARLEYVDALEDIFNRKDIEEMRRDMMKYARDRFDYEKLCDTYELMAKQ